MSLDSIVNVSITRETANISQTGFGTPIILGPNLMSSARIQFFTDLADVDDVLFGGTSAPEYLAATDLLSQNPRVIQVAIGQVASAKVLTYDSGTFTAGDIVTVVNGTTVTTAFITDKDTTLTAHATAIQALDDVLTAVYSTLVLTITPATDAVVYPVPDLTGITGTLTVAVTVGTVTENYDDALGNIKEENNSWYMISAITRDETEQEGIMDWTEANSKFFVAVSNDLDIINVAEASDTTSLAYYASSNSLDRSAVVYHSLAATQYADAAICGKMSPKTPGSYTANFKTLASITVDDLTTTQYTNARAKNANVYMTIASQNIVREGTVGSNEYIDVIIFIDWLQARIQENVYALLVRSDKVPYTNGGIQGIVSVMEQALEIGLQNDGISPFLEDSDGNQIGGFFTSAPALSAVSSADKSSRTLRDVKFTAFLAGAIHIVRIDGIVTL